MKKLSIALMIIMSLILTAAIASCGLAGEVSGRESASVVESTDNSESDSESEDISEPDSESESTEESDSAEPPVHEHVASEWMSDGVYHWKECEDCGEEFDKGACVANGIYEADEEKHWQECVICGGETQSEAHVYETKYDDACSVCDAARSMVTVTYQNGDEVIDTLTIGKGTTADNDIFVDYCVVTTWLKDGEAFDLSTPITEDTLLTVGAKVEHDHAFTWEVGTDEDEGFDVGTCECGKVERLATSIEVDEIQYIGIEEASADVALVLPEGFNCVSAKFGETNLGVVTDNTITINPSEVFTSSDWGVKKLSLVAEGADAAAHTFTFPVLVVTKFINTVDDLGAVKFTGTSISGYYALGGDVDGEGATITSSNYAWDGNSGFVGTFDGRGFTIRNITVTGCGIFSHIGGGAVVKDVNFDAVSLGAGIWGTTGAPLFARMAFNFDSFENITVNFASIKSDINTKEYGLLVSRQMGAGAVEPKWKNLTLNAKGIAVPCALGLEVSDKIVFENVVVNAGELTMLGASDGAGNTPIESKDGVIVNLPTLVSTFAAAQEGDTTLTLNNDAFTEGAIVKVNANAIEKDVEISADGELTLTLSDFNVTTLGKIGVSVEIEGKEYVFGDVWYVTKVITEFSELSLLSNTQNSRNQGYYILGNDIHGSWGTIQGGYSTGWSQNSGFGGTFDGRGYTIDRFSVSGYGIFGCLGQGTVKNVNFEMVTLNNESPLLARTMYNSTIENVTLKLNDYKSTSGECGIFVSRATNTYAAYRNITVDANGKDIYNVLGREVNATTTVENFVINNAGAVTLYGASDTSDTAIAKPAGMTINNKAE